MTTTTMPPRRRRHPDTPVWQEPPTVAGNAGKGVVLVAVVAVVLVPLYSIVLTSLSTQGAINDAGGLVTVPRGLTLEAYRQIFTNQLITHSLLVSLAVTVVGTAVSMVVTVLCAYGLSRHGSFAHRTLLMFLVVTMFFSGGLIPTFLVVTGLGGYGQYWTLILPGAVSVFNILVMRGFFSGTAPELIDAARMDGAGEWRILWSVVLPTSRAVTAVITLFYAVGYWNAFFNALLYLNNSSMWPLQLIVRSYVVQNATLGDSFGGATPPPTDAIEMAILVLSIVPVLVVYPFIQRHFAKGVLTGAIKG